MRSLDGHHLGPLWSLGDFQIIKYLDVHGQNNLGYLSLRFWWLQGSVSRQKGKQWFDIQLCSAQALTIWSNVVTPAALLGCIVSLFGCFVFLYDCIVTLLGCIVSVFGCIVYLHGCIT